MVTYMFNGECLSSIKLAFINTYLQKLELVVETTAKYKKSGIYSAERNHASMPIVIDWGDGTVEQVDGDISQKVHTYTTVGTFNVIVKNIKSYAASIINSTWYNTTSQNAYTLKEVVTIPDSVTSISQHAFRRCSGLASVAIGNGVTSIGDYAFYFCSGLTSVTIPDSVTSIGSSAFDSCSGLTSVTMGNSVTDIGNSAFYNCSGLTSVTIGNGVTSIGDYAFSSCSGLMSFTVGDGNVNYKSVNDLLLSKDGMTLVVGVNGDVTIPDGVTSIGDGAFRYFSNLSVVMIPVSVTSIGDYAFMDCSGLTSVAIPNGVTNIGNQAFQFCSSLTSVTIPDSVMSIGNAAFSNCNSLASVTITGDDMTKAENVKQMMISAGVSSSIEWHMGS